MIPFRSRRRRLGAAFAALVLAPALALSACGQGSSDGASTESAGHVNLYTARHYDSDLRLYERFTELTGIEVRRTEGNAAQLIERMRSEGASGQADVFVASDAGSLWRAQDAGLLQPANSETLNGLIPDTLRADDGSWFGFTRRARVVAYNPERVRPEEVASYEQLAGPRFRGRLCVRAADNPYNLSLVGALIEVWGETRAREWARGIAANMARQPEGGDRDQIRAVAAGVCDVAITNTYYYIRFATGEDAGERAITERVRLGFPSLDGQGSLVNISGGGLAASAPNRANAIRLLEFLASEEAQTMVAEANGEYPASPSVAVPERVRPWAGFTAHPIRVSRYGPHQEQALRIMSEAGWR